MTLSFTQIKFLLPLKTEFECTVYGESVGRPRRERTQHEINVSILLFVKSVRLRYMISPSRKCLAKHVELTVLASQRGAQVKNLAIFLKWLLAYLQFEF